MIKRKRKGAVVVEMALILPLFFLLILSMCEIGRVVSTHQIITRVATSTARHGSVESDDMVVYERAVTKLPPWGSYTVTIERADKRVDVTIKGKTGLFSVKSFGTCREEF